MTADALRLYLVITITVVPIVGIITTLAVVAGRRANDWWLFGRHIRGRR